MPLAPDDRSAPFHPHRGQDVSATGPTSKVADLVNRLTPEERQQVLALLLGGAGPGIRRRTPTPAAPAPMGGMMPMHTPPSAAPAAGPAPSNPMAAAFANRRSPPR